MNEVCPECGETWEMKGNGGDGGTRFHCGTMRNRYGVVTRSHICKRIESLLIENRKLKSKLHSLTVV